MLKPVSYIYAVQWDYPTHPHHVRKYQSEMFNYLSTIKCETCIGKVSNIYQYSNLVILLKTIPKLAD